MELCWKGGGGGGEERGLLSRHDPMLQQNRTFRVQKLKRELDNHQNLEWSKIAPATSI